MLYRMRVKDLTNVMSGTGDLLLAGTPPVGFNDFSGFVANNYVPYFVEDADGVNWESGAAQYLTTPARLVRSAVFESSNSGAAVVLTSGAHTVSLGDNVPLGSYRRGVKANIANGSQTCAAGGFLSVTAWSASTDTESDYVPGDTWIPGPIFADVVDIVVQVKMTVATPITSGKARVAVYFDNDETPTVPGFYVDVEPTNSVLTTPIASLSIPGVGRAFPTQPLKAQVSIENNTDQTVTVVEAYMSVLAVS